METERYRTGQKRIWAAIVDTIVFMPFLLIDKWLLFQNFNQAIIAGWTIFTMLSPIFYRTILHYKYGQTIGKWAADIKVLDIGETRGLTFKQCILRDSIYWTFELSGIIYCIVVFFCTDDFDGLYIISGIASWPLFWWTLLSIIVLFLNKKRRTVHDLLAKSIVVRL